MELLSVKENQNEEAQEQGHIKRENAGEAAQPENKDTDGKPPELEEIIITTKKPEK